MSPGWLLLILYGSVFAILGLIAFLQYRFAEREAQRRVEQRERAYKLLDRLRANDGEVKQ